MWRCFLNKPKFMQKGLKICHNRAKSHKIKKKKQAQFAIQIWEICENVVTFLHAYYAKLLEKHRTSATKLQCGRGL